jgi:iron(III) transport system ATP-binding protein
MSLSIQSLNKTFNGHLALERIDLSIGRTEFVCLLGPSGCGKTTLLRVIAGLLEADGGRITLDGRDLAALPARERGFGIVFQSYSLFGHMTIAQNIAYGLKIRKTSAAVMAQRVQELLDMVRLPGMGDRYPGQLSGGQQQRVAIARALAVNPALLLLDEPLSALDARVRAGLRQELREVQQRLGIPTLMVTHDQEEAMSMADRIVCMNAGRIEQVGTPRDLYLRPRTRFVADFMGHSNLLPAELAGDLLAAGAPQAQPCAGMELCLRPEQLLLSPDPAGEGRVVSVSFLGSIQRVQVQWRGLHLLAEMSSGQSLHSGATVALAVAPQAEFAWVAAAASGRSGAPALARGGL